jgi:hypothetical protein
MPKYFVHENRHYPCPGARAPFEVRARGFIDATIESCSTKTEADALCDRLNSELGDAEIASSCEQTQQSGAAAKGAAPVLRNRQPVVARINATCYTYKHGDTQEGPRPAP